MPAIPSQTCYSVAVTRSAVAAYVAAQAQRLVDAQVWLAHATLSQHISFTCPPDAPSAVYEERLRAFLAALPVERAVADYDDANTTLQFLVSQDGTRALHYAPCRRNGDAMPLPLRDAQWRMLAYVSPLHARDDALTA